MLNYFAQMGVEGVGDWVLIFVSAILVSFGKNGLKGMGMLAIPMFAIVFGGKASTGVLLPILIMADLLAVRNYKTDIEWKYVLKPLPWTLLGIAVGLYVGDNVSDYYFKVIIASVILLSLALMIWRDLQKKNATPPDSIAFAALMGLLGGFATMVGNAAGPIITIYLLALHLPKNSFIGTSARFFLIINILKIPLHIFVWQTISVHTLALGALTIPFIFLGAFLGVRIAKLFPEKVYRIFMYFTTLLAAIAMF